MGTLKVPSPTDAANRASRASPTARSPARALTLSSTVYTHPLAKSTFSCELNPARAPSARPPARGEQNDPKNVRSPSHPRAAHSTRRARHAGAPRRDEQGATPRPHLRARVNASARQRRAMFRRETMRRDRRAWAFPREIFHADGARVPVD